MKHHHDRSAARTLSNLLNLIGAGSIEATDVRATVPTSMETLTVSVTVRSTKGLTGMELAGLGFTEPPSIEHFEAERFARSIEPDEAA